MSKSNMRFIMSKQKIHNNLRQDQKGHNKEKINNKRQEQVQRQGAITKKQITTKFNIPKHISTKHTPMQLQQLRNQNGLLQQLVQTLERQIQSKNQQQTIMIQELEHLIKDNDYLSQRYNGLLAESRKWSEKEKYYERLVREVEEMLAKTRAELGQCKKKLQSHCQPVVGVANIVKEESASMGISQSSPHIQVMAQVGSVSSSATIITRGIEEVKGSSHLIISVPKLNLHNNQQLLSSNAIMQNNNAVMVQQQSIKIQQQPMPYPSPRHPQQPDLITKLQAEIKSLKSLTQSLRLQLTQKDLQLKSKCQKIHQVTQQLAQSQDQVQNLGSVLDELRKEYDLAMGDLEKKEEELKIKDEQFWNMYKEMEEEWKAKADRLEDEVNKLKLVESDRYKELQIREQQLNSLTMVIQQKQSEIQSYRKQVKQMKAQQQSKNSTIPNHQQSKQNQQQPQQNQQIQSLKNLVQVLHQTISDTQNRYTLEIQKVVKESLTKEENYQRNEKRMNEENRQIKEQINKVETENIQLRGRISSIETLNNQWKGKSAILQRQYNQLQAQTTLHQSQNNLLRQRIAHFETQANILTGTISTYQTQNNQLKEKVSIYHVQNNQLKERILTQNNQLRGKVAIYEAQNDQLREKIFSYEAQVSQLKERITVYETQHNQLRERILSFEAQTNQLRNGISQTLARNTDQVHSSHPQHIQFRQRIGSIQTQNNQLKGKLQLLNSQLQETIIQYEQSMIANDKLAQEKEQMILEKEKRNNSLRQLAATVEITKVELNEKDRMIQENLTQIGLKQKQVNQVNLLVKQLENKLQYTQQRLEQAQTQLKQSQNVFIQTQTIIQQLQQENESLIKQAMTIKQQKQQLLNQITSFTQPQQPSYPTLFPVTNNRQQQTQSLQKQNNQLRQQVNEFAKNFEEIGVSVQEMRATIDELEARLKDKEQDNGHLVNQLQQLNLHNMNLLEEVAHLKEQLARKVLVQKRQQQRQQQKQSQLQRAINKQSPPQNNSHIALQPPSPLSIQSSPHRLTSKLSNHVELQMFQALQQQYTRLYDQLQEIKLQSQEQRSRFIAVIKEKDYELSVADKKMRELTGLFVQKSSENDKLRESIDKQSLEDNAINVFGKSGNKNMANTNTERFSLINSNTVSNNNHNNNNHNHHNNNNYNKNSMIIDKPNGSKNPSPSHIPQYQQAIHRSLARQQQNHPSLPRNQNPSPPRQLQSRPSLTHQLIKPVPLKQYTQNLVQNNLSSPRSHQQKTLNQILQDQLAESSNGFDIRIQPTVRQSDLPLHSPQFIQNNSQTKPQRPKSNITSVDNNKRQHLQAVPVQIDINYLRNSIAEFGIDIDFNAIAKHIGLELSEQEEEQRRVQEERQRKRLNSGRYNIRLGKDHINLIPTNNHQSSMDHSIDNIRISDATNKRQIQKNVNQAMQQHLDDCDHVITSKQRLQANNHNFNNSPKNKKLTGMYSSYGSNPSKSQKRSTPGALGIPMVDEQLMRSSYGSNNQFTQIVLYYEQELNKLRRQIGEMNDMIEKERERNEERFNEMVKQNDERLERTARENEENLVKIYETEGILEHIRSEQQARHIKQEGERKQSEQLYEDNNRNSHNEQPNCRQQQPPITTIPGNISPVYFNPPTANNPIAFFPLPQTSEFRTSIEPRMAANFQLYQNNLNYSQGYNLNNSQGNSQGNSCNPSPSISMTPEEQQETVELIRELSSQLEIVQQTLTVKQDEMRLLEVRNQQLERENEELVEQVEMIRRENQSIVNQFSELSLQQNNCITELEGRIEEVLSEKDQNIKEIERLIGEHKEMERLIREHRELVNANDKLKERLSNKQPNNQQLQQLRTQLYQLTTQLTDKSVMIQKITIQNIEYETQLLQLNQQVQQLVGKLQQIQQLHEQATNDNEEKIKRLQKSLRDHDKFYKDQEKTYRETKDQLLRYMNENESLAGEYSKFIQTSKQLEVIAKKYQELETYVKEVQGNNRALSSQYQQLQTNYNALQNTNKTLQNSNKTLDNENKTLQTNYKTLDNQNKTLQTQYRSLQTQYRSLQNQYRSLQTQHKSLQTQHKSLQTQYKSLQTQHKFLQTQHKSLQAINKNVQQKLCKPTYIPVRQSVQSPTLPYSNQQHQFSRISDLIDPSSLHQTCHQQNFTINNISNIHAIVDQLGDDSFVLHEKDKQISTLKDIVERQRREIQQLADQAKDRQSYISEMQDKFANIENSFNSEMMEIKKQNAQMNAELLKLKKQLFMYQKDTGDIDKFIQENFLKQTPIITVGKRFSVQDKNQHNQPKFQSQITYHANNYTDKNNYTNKNKHNNKSERHNNSFNFQPHNPHDVSSLTSRNKANMTQFYYPKEKLPTSQSTPLNMGELFIGHKTRARAQNPNTDNSLTQLIKSITSNNKHKSMTQPTGHRAQTNYSKYLNDYERYEEKFKQQQGKNFEPQFQMVSYGVVGHMKKRSDHGE